MEFRSVVLMGRVNDKNQEEIRRRLNEIQDEYGELWWDLDEKNAKIMDWIVLMHMDLRKLQRQFEIFFHTYKEVESLE